MSAGTEVAIDVLLGLVKAAPAVGEVLGGLIGGTASDVEKRLERAKASIKDPIDTSADDADRWERLQGILRGEQPIGERETQPPANPYPDAS